MNLIKDVHSYMVAIRRDLHQHPEIGFDLPRTSSLVASELKKLGLAVKEGVGITADLNVGGKTTIALRADMDALPIQELSNSSYKSRTPNKAHLCGHDAHTAMLLGAATVLSKMPLKNNVRFIFQPNEEQFPGGAAPMIDEGALDGVNAIYALHVWPTLPVGKYGICLGPAMAQPDSFTVTITGCGGHAAAPHAAIDPIAIASSIVSELNRHKIKDGILTITQIHGGSTYNVIPQTCTFAGTVRTYDKGTQDHIRKMLDDICKKVTTHFGASYETTYVEGYPVTFNHEESVRDVLAIATKLVGKDHVDFPAKNVMFGEDFGYYTQKVKGCFIHLGCRNEEKGITRMLHDPYFDIDEECLIHGAAMHVALGSNAGTSH